MDFSRVAELQALGKEIALCVIVKTTGSTPRRAGAKMIVFPDGQFEGTVGGGEMESLVIKEAIKAIESGQSTTVEYQMTDPHRGDPGVCGGQLEVYVEPIVAKQTLVVVGAGHVGKAVVELAHWLDFQVIVLDDRDGFANAESVPDADEYFSIPLSQLPNKVNIHRNTFIVLSTRGVDVDVEGLPAILESEAGYIGVIGSKRRWKTTEEKLLEKGISKELLNRVVSPMGLEIDAETPEEIALSILAEIVMLRRGGDGKRMTRVEKE